MADEKKLRILIEAILREKGFNDAEQALKDLEKQTKKTGDSSSEASEQLDGMLGKTASMLGTFGTVMTVIGGGMTPIIRSAQQYVQTVQLANETSREWLATTEQIEIAQRQIGKVNADFLTPIYSKFGDVMERLGDFAEDNPLTTILTEFAGGAAGTIGVGNILGGLAAKLGLGGVAGAITTGTTVAGTAIPAVGIVATEAYADKQMRDKALEIIKKNEEQGNVRIDPKTLNWQELLAYSIGAETDPYWGVKQYETPQEAAGRDRGNEKEGKEENQPFWDKLVESFRDAFSEVKTSGTVVSQAVQNLPSTTGAGQLEDDEVVVKKTFWQSIKEFFDDPLEGFKNLFSFKDNDSVPYGTGQSTVTVEDRINANDKTEFLTTGLVQAMMQFRKQELYAQEDFQRSYNHAIDDFNRNRIYQEEDYNRQRTITYRNFAIQQAQSERMFYLQRSLAQRDFQISQARNDYDYHKNRARAEEDYNFSLQQIMLSGDALAYYYAKRQHDIDVRRAEEDYQLQRERAIEDFNRSQADSLMFYNIQRQFQQQMFELSMQDREVEYQIMRDRAEFEFYSITLPRMELEYQIMANRRLQAFYESIAPAILEENKLKLYYQSLYLSASVQGYINSAAALQSYFNSIVQAYSQSTFDYWTPPQYGPQMESGGYTTEQQYQLHDHEFVLTRNSTEKLEQALGGRLTQDTVSSLASLSNMRDNQVSSISQGKLMSELFMAMMSGLRQGVVYNDNRQFSRGISVDEKTQLRQELRQMVIEAFK